MKGDLQPQGNVAKIDKKSRSGQPWDRPEPFFSNAPRNTAYQHGNYQHGHDSRQKRNGTKPQQDEPEQPQNRGRPKGPFGIFREIPVVDGIGCSQAEKEHRTRPQKRKRGENRQVKNEQCPKQGNHRAFSFQQKVPNRRKQTCEKEIADKPPRRAQLGPHHGCQAQKSIDPPPSRMASSQQPFCRFIWVSAKIQNHIIQQAQQCPRKERHNQAKHPFPCFLPPDLPTERRNSVKIQKPGNGEKQRNGGSCYGVVKKVPIEKISDGLVPVIRTGRQGNGTTESMEENHQSNQRKSQDFNDLRHMGITWPRRKSPLQSIVHLA